MSEQLDRCSAWSKSTLAAFHRSHSIQVAICAAPAGGCTPTSDRDPKVSLIERPLHRWRVAWTSFLLLAVCGGTHFYVLPVALGAVQEQFALSLAATTLTLLIWGVTGAVTSPLIGRAIDRWGAHQAVLLGTALQAVSFVVIASASSIELVYLGFALSAVALGANGYMPVSAAISLLFDRDRGKAMGLAMFGLGVGGLVVPNVTQRLLVFGWQNVYGIYAVVCLVMLPIVAFGLRSAGPSSPRSARTSVSEGTRAEPSTDPGALDSDPPLRELFSTRSFWGLGLGDAFTGLIFAFFTVHFVSLASESGITPATATLFFGVFLFLGAPGTLILGVLADSFSTRTLTIVCYALPVLLVPALFALPNLFALGAFALVPGFLAGGRAAMFPLAVGFSFGARNVARVYGWLNVAFLLGTAVGPLLSGLLHDASGNYRSSIWMAWLVGGLSVALISWIRPERGWATPARSVQDRPA